MTNLKKTIRHLVFWSAIGLVLILLAIILGLTTAGFKFNLKTKKFVKTGMLYIKSVPTDVNVFLNAKLSAVRTPLRLGFLLPGQYEVRITKKGYLDWIKNIQIEPEKVTREKNIILFKEKPEIETLAENVKSFIISADKKIAFLANNELWQITDSKKEKVELPEKFDLSSVILLEWNVDSTKILAKNSKDYLVFDIQNPKNSFYFTEKVKFNPDYITFNPKAGHLAFGLAAEKLFLLDLLTGKSSEIANSIINLAFSSDSLYFIQKTNSLNNSAILKKSTLFGTTATSVTVSESLPENPQSILVSENNIWLIKDNFNNLWLPVEKKGKFIFEKIAENVQVSSWTKDQTNLGKIFDFLEKPALVFSTDFEIFTWQPTENQLNLVTRVSQKIKQILWYPDQSHIVFAVDAQIKIIENSGTNLVSAGSFQQPFYFLDNGEKIIYLDSGKLISARIR